MRIKKTELFYSLVLLGFSQIGLSATFDSYYGGIDRYNGSDLKKRVKAVISKSHNPKSYDDLYDAYFDGDTDKMYEQDGSIVDIYSEDPKTKDPYTYDSRNQRCGSYKHESSCFNREHLLPQSVFFKRSPMRTDYYHVFPTDGYVNGKRSNHPFGEVDREKWVSKNGSKLGSQNSKGYNGTVFEPIDEFKGDVARALLYFFTRYEDKLPGFKNWGGLNKSANHGIEVWFLELLLKWHRQDPVSIYEQNRNEAGFRFQGNRNPFVDHPEWVERIFNQI